MENEHVLSGLLRKRVEVVNQHAKAQAEVDRLLTSLASLEATIRLFSPEAALPVVRVPLIPRQRVAFHGELSRPMLSILRDTPSPMATREVALAVIAARGYDPANMQIVRSVHKRVNSSLRELRDRGVVQSERRADKLTWWWIVR